MKRKERFVPSTKKARTIAELYRELARTQGERDNLEGRLQKAYEQIGALKAEAEGREMRFEAGSTDLENRLHKKTILALDMKIFLSQLESAIESRFQEIGEMRSDEKPQAVSSLIQEVRKKLKQRPSLD